MTEDLFSNTAQDTNQLPAEYDPNVNYVEMLVGEGKKFHGTTEQEAYNKLAFAKLESDRFVDRLKGEQANLRADLLTRQRLEEIVTKLGTSKQNEQTPNSGDNQGHERMDTVNSSQQNEFKGLTIEEVDARLDERMRSRANLEKALAGLKSVYGDNYQTVLDAEAKSLNVDKTFVNNLAKTNPDAFLRMFVKQKPQEDFMAPPSSNITPPMSSGTTTNGIRNKKFYDDLKTKNPTVYWSPKIQQQEYEDAKKLGPAFGW
jgi:hypothetical protein